MELAIATVIQSLDVKEERDFDITYGHVCLEVCLLLAENVLGWHLNLDYCSVLFKWFSEGHFQILPYQSSYSIIVLDEDL